MPKRRAGTGSHLGSIFPLRTSLTYLCLFVILIHPLISTSFNLSVCLGSTVEYTFEMSQSFYLEHKGLNGVEKEQNVITGLRIP